MMWTDARTEELRELVGLHLSARQIAWRMGITRNAVIGKCQRARFRLHSGQGGRSYSPDPLPASIAKRKSRARLRSAAVRATRKPVPGTPIKAAPLPPTCEPVTLLARSDFQCAYPIGETAGPDTLMCGGHVEGRSLCAYHLARCWVGSDPKRRRVVWFTHRRVAA
jgi:hypothetical protein